MLDTAIRSARDNDAEAIVEVLREYVLSTAISFETVPPDADKIRRKLASLETPHGALVAEQGERIVGYACSSQFRQRPAYASSAELSVYVSPSSCGAGIGRALASELIARLTLRGVHRAYGYIALPNDASVRMVEALGFRRVGLLDEVGFKLGRFWSVAIYERALA